MKQIAEDYVSLEIAKLLKKKGFDEFCSYEFGVPNIDKGYVLQKWVICNGQIRNSDLIDGAYTAPTLQMALKWLREVHDLHIIVYPWQADNEEKAIHWCCTVYKSFAHLGNDVYTNETPKSYEEAVEAALKYSLENLI